MKRGSVTVKIYRTPTKGYESFTVQFYQDGVRQRRTFSDFADAKQEAETTAAALSSNEAGLVRLTSADSAAYLRAKQLLDPLGIPLEVAAAEIANAHERLAGVPNRPVSVSLSRVIDDYLKRNPVDIAPRSVDDVLQEMLSAKASDGLVRISFVLFLC